MKKIKNIYIYYAIHFMIIALGIYLATFSGDAWVISLSVLISIIYCAIVFGLFIKKIPVNKATALIDRRSGDLYPQHLSTGYWLTWGLFKEGDVTKLLDATVNPNTVTVVGQSKDQQEIQVKATMNDQLFSAYRHIKYITKDEDDVKQAKLEDFGNTVRNLISLYNADELLAKENISGADIENQIRKKTDSLRETLNRVGYKALYFTIDDVNPTAAFKEANAALEQARKIARGDEFNEKESLKLTDFNLIKYLLGEIKPRISKRDLQTEALDKLGWSEEDIHDNHEKEQTLYDEMVTIAATKANISNEKLLKLRGKATQDYMTKKGLIQAYSGLGKAKPFVGAGK